MKHPTWSDVGIPNSLLNIIRGLKNYQILDAWLNFIVLHKELSKRVVYRCVDCDYVYEPKKFIDEVAECHSCRKKSYVGKYNFTIRDMSYYCSKKNSNIMDIVHFNYTNFINYFNQEPEFGFDCGWTNRKPYCKFEGGELVSSNQPQRTILAKAALLTPYNWDSNFPWNQGKSFNFISHKLLFSGIEHEFV